MTVGGRNALTDAERVRAAEALAALRWHDATEYYHIQAKNNEKVVDLRDVWPQPRGTTGRIGRSWEGAIVGRRAVVDILALTRGQTTVPVPGVAAYIERQPTRLPVIADYPDGQLQVTEGHTRLTVLLLAGRREAEVRVVRVDARGRRARGA